MLKKLSISERYFSTTRYFKADPASTALIAGQYATLSSPHVLIIILTGYVLLTGSMIYDIISTSQSEAQFAIMFPDEGPADMFFITDNDLRLIFEYLRNLLNAGQYLYNPSDYIAQFSIDELRSFSDDIDVVIESLYTLDQLLDLILELDDPMYNISYEMIVRIREQELHQAIGYIEHFRNYISYRLMNGP